MTITPMMQYIQDRILEAVHGCTLEEARKKDYYRGGKITPRDGEDVFKIIGDDDEFDDKGVYIKYESRDMYLRKRFDIFGLPPTLSRVLTALGNGFFIENELLCQTYKTIRGERTRNICSRKLLNEDKSDSSLSDQSQETITAIGVLLGRKDE